MQMLERGVPVWDLLAEAMGKSAAEVQKLSEQGRLGREEITLLTEALGARYSGASQKASETWDGIISNLDDQWTRFQRMVMDAGLFDWMKDKLDGLLDRLDEMAKDGTLQVWATSLSNNITLALSGIFWAISGIFFFIKDELYPALESVATAVGGWDVLGWIALALMFSGTLLKVASGIRLIAAGLLLLSANPVLALTLAFAALAYVIYDNWDTIVSYFSDKIEAVRAAFDEGLLNGVFIAIAEFNPFTLLTELLIGLPALFAETFLGIDLYDAGARIMTSLWDGMKSVMTAIVDWANAKLDAITPDWLRSPEAGGTAGIGGDSGYGGMAGAMDDMAAFAAPLAPAAPLRMRAAPNGPSTNVNVGGITVNAAPGQSPEAVAREVRRQLSEAAAIRSWLDDRGLHAD
jgi:hypothetical protein